MTINSDFSGGWEFECLNCGARISSGWFDPICPVCKEYLMMLSYPKPSEKDIKNMLREAERILRE